MGSANYHLEKVKRVDRLLDVLSHHLRREVIHYFEKSTDDVSASMEDMTTHMAARIPDRDKERLAMTLRHVHLPKLQADGWLEFDPRNEEIRYHGHEAMPRLLEQLSDAFTE